MRDSPSIIWFRRDLRLADNPMLQAAVQRGAPVLPLFIWAPEEEAPWEPGAASRWWLHQSLQTLERDWQGIGSRLLIRRGPSHDALRALAQETGAGAVFWNRGYEPAIIARDLKIKKSLQAAGLEAESFNGGLLHEPWTIQNKSAKPYQVFTPFWKYCLAQAEPGPPLTAPRKIVVPQRWPDSLPLANLKLEPAMKWAEGFRARWQPGSAGAHAHLRRFLRDRAPEYALDRNRPDLAGTSRLSPHLHFGEISPREIWHALRRNAPPKKSTELAWRHSPFLTELGWREFAHHLLFHFPHTPTDPLRTEFKRFPWREDVAGLMAWQKGRTGYPIVDAGMRELWATGWMHNRVRMIVASFLVKDLLLPWQEGSRWFWETLVDADLAQNTLGWQWTAGCGADAAPFFRIFNPTSQGQKFDPQGDYVRRWCPELARLPTKWIHAPQQAPLEILATAGVEMGRTYPEPVLSHTIAREVALEAFLRLKQTTQGQTRGQP